MPREFALVLSILFALLGAWVIHLSNRIGSMEKGLRKLRQLAALQKEREEESGSDGESSSG